MKLPTKIATKLFVFAVILVILFIISVFCTIWLNLSRQNIALAVNISGRNRMLTQRMAYFAGRIYENNPSVKTALVDSMNLFQQSLTILRIGGVVPGLDYVAELNSAKTLVLPALDEADRIWVEYKKNIEILLRDDAAKDRKDAALQRVRDLETSLLQANNSVVTKYIEYDKRLELYFSLFIFFVFATWVPLIILATIELRKILNELRKTVEYAREMSKNAGKVTVPVHGNDEFTEVAQAFNLLNSEIKKSVDSLEQRLADQTQSLQDSFNKLKDQNETLSDSKTAMLNVMEDLDRQKEQLEKSQLELAEAQKIAKVGNFIWELGTNKMHWSDESFLIHGFSPASNHVPPVLDEYYQAIEKSDRPGVKASIKKALQSREENSYVYRVMWPDQSLHYVKVTSHLIEDESKKQQVLKGTFQDVTSDKLQEIALQEAKQKDEVLLESIGEGMAVTDEKGVITLVNPSFSEILGFKVGEVVGHSLIEKIRLVDQNDQDVALEERPFRQVFKTGKKVRNSNFSYLTKDGKKIAVDITVSPLYEGDRIIGVIEIFRDITKEKQIEKMKSEFVSVASHELRTPLAAIDGLVAMIREGEYGKISPELQIPLADINTASERLISLVNDLLSLSRIESGRLKYTLEAISITEVVDSVLANLDSLAQPKHIKLMSTVKTAQVSVDKNKVAQILTNLVGNALKFTDAGSITVTTAKNGDYLEVRVVDTGIGIKKEDQAKLFGKFQQLDAQQGRPAGTGLGLYLSKEMVRKMGGELNLESSEVGKGSTFIFTLPLANTTLAKKIIKEIQKEEQEHLDQKSDLIVSG